MRQIEHAAEPMLVLVFLPSTMRITDYRIGRLARNLRQFRSRMRMVRCLRSVPLKVRVLRELRIAEFEYRVRNLRTIAISTCTFNINSISEESCLADYCFRLHEVGKIADLIGWDRGYTKRNRYKCSSVADVCVMLRRLASRCRYRDIEVDHGMHASKLSKVFWEVCTEFNNKFGRLVTDFRVDLLHDRASLYSYCIQRRGGSLPNCFGFMDGTKIEIARPGGDGANQRSCYSGHKRFHCLTYQTITTPDGLIFHLFGPVEGRKPDAYMYSESGMDDMLRENTTIEGTQYYLYADKAYTIRSWMQCVYSRPAPSVYHNMFNMGDYARHISSANPLPSSVMYRWSDILCFARLVKFVYLFSLGFLPRAARNSDGRSFK